MNCFRIILSILVLPVAFGCGGGGASEAGSPGALRSGVARLPGEEVCASAPSAMDLKICRAELRLRAARRGTLKEQYECYNDRVGQMHAAARQRDSARKARRERVALGFESGHDSGDDQARIQDAEQRVSQLWDQIQSGVCE